jgi:hypothetical protein
VTALLAVEPVMRHQESGMDQQRSTVYEVLGYDIVLDEHLKPWICEARAACAHTSLHAARCQMRTRATPHL